MQAENKKNTIMKNRIFTTLLLLTAASLLFFSCQKNSKKGNATIYGKISNNVLDSLFYKMPVALGIEFDEQSIAVSDDGEFSFSIQIDSTREALLSNGKDFIKMYVEPGDSLYLETDAIDFVNNAKFNGKGSKKQNYLVERQRKFEFSNDTVLSSILVTGSEKALLNYIDSLKKIHTDFLNNNPNFDSFSSDFINNQLSQIEYSQSFVLFMKIHGMAIDNRGKLDTTNISKDYYTRFKDYDNLPNNLKSSISYFDYIYTKRALLGMEQDVKTSNFSTQKESQERDLQNSIKYFSGLERDLAYSQILFLNLINLDTTMYDYFEDQFLSTIENGTIRNQVISKRKSIAKLLNTKPNSETTLFNLSLPNSAQKSLEEIIAKYKGKPVYLNIWAGWNPQSRLNLKDAERLRKRFENEVHVISFSLDTDSKWWKKMVVVDGISGENYLLGIDQVNSLTNDFQLLDIPRYILFDKNGKVVKSHAPVPGDPQVVVDIMESLKK